MGEVAAGASDEKVIATAIREGAVLLRLCAGHTDRPPSPVHRKTAPCISVTATRLPPRPCRGCSWHHLEFKRPARFSQSPPLWRQNGLTDSYLYATLQLLWPGRVKRESRNSFDFSALGR